MVYFFSNHKNTSFLEQFLREEVTIIPHPYIEPQWSMEDLIEKCDVEISLALLVDKLIINGDHSLVSYIVVKRNRLGKKTGFITFQKLNEPTKEKDNSGNIVHKNILRPISVRWL